VSRICVVATGVPSAVEAPTHHGPGLRTTHFVTALVEAGMDVLVIAILSERDALYGQIPDALDIGGRRVALLKTTERDLAGEVVRRAIGTFAPDGFIGVSAMASALACDVVGESPLWADVFGDLMAEAQAKAIVYDNDTSLARFGGLLVRTLSRADRFSAVSSRQADALLGQLGLAGRLSKHTAGEALVEVIPCAAGSSVPATHAHVEALRTRLGLTGAFVVLWSGSFNTWCDVDTLYDGLTQAMQRCPELHFVATGGVVAGHDENTHKRLLGLVAAGDCGSRFHFEGWVAVSELKAYYALADVAINLELARYERRLGSENRVVEWLAASLPIVTTALSEQGEQLSAAGAVEAVPVGRAEVVADVLVALAADPRRLADLSAAATAYASANLDFAETAAPLLKWAQAPLRSGDAGSQPVVRIGLVSQPKTMVALLEAYVDELGTAELIRRGGRWLWRRLWGGAAG